MSYDGVFTFAAAREFNSNLSLGKIEKIYQPHKEQLVLVIHTKQGKKRLFISASGNHSAMYFIEKTPENPATPPVFCMVLRKHLNAARITEVQQHENDRIIEIFMESVNELGFSVNKKLVVEIMGKHSNILLVDTASNKIIDSIKHVSIDVNRARQILPGKIYEYPPTQNKLPFTKVSEKYMSEITTEQTQPERCVLDKIQGISPALAQTISAADNPYKALKKIIEDIDAGSLSPVVYVEEDNKPVDFHVVPLNVYDGVYDSISFDSLSLATDYFFSHKDSTSSVRQKSNDLTRVLTSHIDKLHLKTKRLNEDLIKAENSDKYRLYGELLTANISNARQGEASVSVLNYYDNTTVDIPLDPKFTPAKNAQNYFKKYGKAKTAIKEKNLQLQQAASELEYLESVLALVQDADTVEALELLRQEMVESGILRYRKKKGKDSCKQRFSPHKYILPSGHTVFAGRNNKENDWLTLKKASSRDIWLHTKDIPGTHVILSTEGVSPSDDDIAMAAQIAAYHSKGSDSENVPVDYTLVKHVKKPSGAKPGMVIFTHNKTLFVTPKLP